MLIIGSVNDISCIAVSGGLRDSHFGHVLGVPRFSGALTSFGGRGAFQRADVLRVEINHGMSVQIIGAKCRGNMLNSVHYLLNDQSPRL